jgi:hypothetical protein
MLDDDISLFMHAFPDADDKELRAHCLSTLSPPGKREKTALG